ncbi:MAG: NAD(+)/NADH kinase [Candidatus Omnitrophica bacterium]|nr:NAD(+)/NADH kinase [Candidatus Omnitrophota bacterium]
MKNLLSNVLVLYKKSAYSIYFKERKNRFPGSTEENMTQWMGRFKKAHDEHYATLKTVERVLGRYGIRYKKQAREQRASYQRYSLVITVGGDGTFLEAARHIRRQVILGVNSSPSTSVGKLCTADHKDFERIILGLIQNSCRIELWQRLRIEVKGRRPVEALNDVLICHRNPAALSRYYLQLKGAAEQQRSSGLWVSTPAGSSGAIKSAGGKILKITDKKIQYMPRELYYAANPSARLKGGVLAEKKTIEVTSLMRNGMIYVDGTHHPVRFPFNAKVKISLSPHPLRTVHR